MRHDNYQYSRIPTDEPDEFNKEKSPHPIAVSYCSDESDDSLSILELPKKQDTVLITEALIKGGAKTYFDRVKLHLKASFLLLPGLVVNAYFIFIPSQETLEEAMHNNIYYDHYFNKLIPTFSYESAILSAEAAGITTTSVFIAILVTAASLSYQSIKYLLNKNKMEELIIWLDELDYLNAEKLIHFPLSSQQYEEIRSLVQRDAFDENTIIITTPSKFEQFISDLLWFNKESHKYLTPFLLASLIPGFLLMYQTAQEVEDEMDCTSFPLWALLFDDLCPVIQKIELMSLLTYLWACFSGTYLTTHSLALMLRILMTPFKSARDWFEIKINRPFSNWWGGNQEVDQLIEKIFLYTLMPPAIGYSLYSSIQFTQSYLAETGCFNLGQVLDKAFISNKIYPCSSTQASLGISVLLADFEFIHLYPVYLLIESLASLSTLIRKRFSYFQREPVIEQVKKMLARFTAFEEMLSSPFILGVIFGGLAGLWPALRLSNTILQKEGFELFFPLNDLTLPANLTLPDNLPNQPIPFNQIFSNTPSCTIGSTIGSSSITLGNMTLPWFNATFPCVEVFFDPILNSTIVGLQVTAPCPHESIYSVYSKNLLHLPLDCDPILAVRSIAGFVTIYWLSVNTSVAGSLTFATLFLLSGYAVKGIINSTRRPAHNSVHTDSSEQKSSYFPPSLSSRENDSIELQTFSSNREELSDDEFEADLKDQTYVNDDPYDPPTCWTKLKNKLPFFFSSSALQASRDDDSRRPLIGHPRASSP